MKQISRTFVIILCSALFHSCSTGTLSSYKETIIPWVYAETVQSFRLEEPFIEYRRKTINDLKFLTNNHEKEFSALCVLIKSCINTNDEKLDLESSLRSTNSLLFDDNGSGKYSYYQGGYFISNLCYYLRFSENESIYYRNLFANNISTVKANVTKFLKPYEAYVAKLAIENTEIVDGGIDANNIGDSYTGFYFVYKVRNLEKQYRYVLVSLIEYDDDSRYEAEIIATENSLRAINEYIEK